MNALLCSILLALLLAPVAHAQGTEAITLYANDFETPNVPLVKTCGDALDDRGVNLLYGTIPFPFQQMWTVETVMLTDPIYSDPSGIGGTAAIGMLSTRQDDLLALTLNVHGKDFLNVSMDITSIDVRGCGGPFGVSNPRFRLKLVDSPNGVFAWTDPVLDQVEITGNVGPNAFTTLWTHHAEALDASRSTTGHVTLVWDLLESGYAGFDNLVITASDTSSFDPLEYGQVVMTDLSGVLLGADSPVVKIYDVRYPGGAFPSALPPAWTGTQWSPPEFYNVNGGADAWTRRNLGEVFGIALSDDDAPDIYVAATTVYGRSNDCGTNPNGLGCPHPTNGPGAIYCLDGVTGAISLFAQLPNSGPGIGQIAYDREHDQLFASNMDDGLIYRLDASAGCGTQVTTWDTYDHGLDGLTDLGRPAVLDNGTVMNPGYGSDSTTVESGFTQLDRRVWAVQVHEGRLYYGTWREDRLRPHATEKNEVLSVDLTATGGFNTSVIDLVVVPEVSPGPIGGQYTNPISDIAFSPAPCGQMLVAERTMLGDVGLLQANGLWAHQSRVLEYYGSSWQFHQQFFTGQTAGGANAAGGVDYNHSVLDAAFAPGLSASTVVLTADQALVSPFYLYGFQTSPASGQPYAFSDKHVSLYVDWNGVSGTQDKSTPGDIEAYRNHAPGSGPSVLLTATPSATTVVRGGGFSINATLKSLSDVAQPLDIWLTVTGYPTYTRLLGRGTLPACHPASARFNLRVPCNTPLGTYRVTVNAGTFSTNTIQASVSFAITVAGPPCPPTESGTDGFTLESAEGDFVTSTAGVSEAPAVLTLGQSTPNPTSGLSEIPFALPVASEVRLSVYDVLGREVVVLVDGYTEAGAHRVPFDGRGLASGTYVYRLTTGGQVQTGRMTLTR